MSFGLLKYNNSENIKSENISSIIGPSNPLDSFIDFFIQSRFKLQTKTKVSKKKRSNKKDR